MCIRDRLIVGQTVPVVSRTGSAAPRPATGRPYLVAAGDTLLTVAAAHKLTPAALAAANGLSGSNLFPGQRLRIPDATAVYRDLPQGWLDVRVSPTNPGQGSTVAITVANRRPGTPAGRLGEQALHFAPAADGYVALVGLDAFAEPGLYDLEISGGDERGLWQPLRARLPVTATAYDTQYITVGEALDGLLDPAVRATEDEFLHGIFAVFDETQHWEGVFQYPVTTTIISAGYGGRPPPPPPRPRGVPRRPRPRPPPRAEGHRPVRRTSEREVETRVADERDRRRGRGAIALSLIHISEPTRPY